MLESSTLIMWMAEEFHYSSNRASTIWKALLQNRVVGETSDSRYTCSGQPGQKRRQRAPSLNDRAPFRRKSHTVSVAHSAGPATGSSVLASTDARAIMSEVCLNMRVKRSGETILAPAVAARNIRSAAEQTGKPVDFFFWPFSFLRLLCKLGRTCIRGQFPSST